VSLSGEGRDTQRGPGQTGKAMIMNPDLTTGTPAFQPLRADHHGGR
jgi:hypothetical protein